jgi:3-hydroxyacyl-[acyl-carrier-protein] dehydratase
MTRAVEFDFSISEEHPALPGHFPQQPIVPGVLLLDHVLSKLQRETGRSVIRLQHVKFTSAMQPREQAHVRCEVGNESVVFRVTVQRNDVAVTVAMGSMAFGQYSERSW